MRDYRFLLLDRDLRALRFLEVSCLDDEAAMTLAAALGARHAVDVLHGARLVGGVRTPHVADPDFGMPVEAAETSAPAPARARPQPRLDA